MCFGTEGNDGKKAHAGRFNCLGSVFYGVIR